MTCQRYLQRSYNHGTPSGTSSTGGAEIRSIGSSVPNDWIIGSVSFRTIMRVSPTLVVYGNLGGATRVSDGYFGTDFAANSGQTVTASEKSFQFANKSGGALTLNANTVVFHWTADARL